jgi:tetratricopeptide (TPR) repeat protein
MLDKLFIGLTTLFVLGSAMAQNIPGYPDDVFSFDPRETAQLPEYCKYTQTYRDHVEAGNDPARIAHWYEVLGKGFHHMHHYCNGLMMTNRALLLVRTKQWREWYLIDSIREFDYVIRSVNPDFPMLPEILTKKGENQLRLNRIGLAIQTLSKAAALKPDYWPPYVDLADFFVDSGNPSKAREWLEKGLAASPDAQPLKRRLAELDKRSVKAER